MTTKEKYYVFINKLKSYNYLKNEIIDINKELSDKWYDLFGVRGVDPSKIRIENYDQKKADEQIIEKLNLYNQLEKEKQKEIDHINYQLNQIDEQLIRMDDLTRNIFIDKYINNISFEQLSKKYSLSIGGLQSKMRSEFNKGAKK